MLGSCWAARIHAQRPSLAGVNSVVEGGSGTFLVSLAATPSLAGVSSIVEEGSFPLLLIQREFASEDSRPWKMRRA